MAMGNYAAAKTPSNTEKFSSCVHQSLPSKNQSFMEHSEN